MLLHRNGHAQGDDFALYLRQARSIFDGDIGAVVADNRFAVLNSDRAVQPDRVSVGLAAAAVAVRARVGTRLRPAEARRGGALLRVAGARPRRRPPAHRPSHGARHRRRLAPHRSSWCTPTSCCAEFPYARHGRRRDLVVRPDQRAASSSLTARVVDLVVLGVLVAIAFNVRREGMVLIARHGRDAGRRARRRRARHPRQAGAPVAGISSVATSRTIFVPFGTFGVERAAVPAAAAHRAAARQRQQVRVHRRSLGRLPEDPEPTRRSRQASRGRCGDLADRPRRRGRRCSQATLPRPSARAALRCSAR